MNIKFIDNKKNNQKGFISLIVIYSVLFFVIVLIGILAKTTANEKTQINSTARIKAKYEKNMDNIMMVYNSTIEE